MNIGKYKIDDLNKLVKTLSLSKSPSVFNVSQDGPRLLFSFIGDDGKQVTITLFDAETNTMPTITKTDYLT